MKNSLKLLLICTIFVGCNSCSNHLENVSATLIAPTGTPLFAISPYLHEREAIEETIVDGATPLLSAFTSKSHDLIVAPINLGAQIYQKSKDYQLFETIVWGNLYVASRNPLSSFQDLADQKVTIFGTNQTPDIVIKCLCEYYHISLNIERVDDVTNANAYLLQGVSDYIISAEPSLSKLKEKIPNLFTLDLQEEWKNFSGVASYPQAGIFIKKARLDDLKGDLNYLKDSIENILNDVDYTVSCAMEQEKLASLGEDTLKNALPNCHIGIEEKQKEAINFYFTKLMDIGLGNTMGGQLPDDDFYCTL